MKAATIPLRKSAACRLGTLALAVISLILSLATTFGESAADHAVPLSATIQRAPPSIRLSWSASPDATRYTVFRKLVTSASWESGTVLDDTRTEYLDTSASVAKDYDYSVVKSAPGYTGYGFIAAGIDLPLIEARGKIVLIVEKSVADGLPAELALLEQDLVGDGWVVLRHEVASDDSVKRVKELIVADFDADPTHVKTIFLLGHVPVPYSGIFSPDGHPDHLGAWPADAYYGDMDGEWTDASVNNTAAADSRNWNIPGDGKFDQSTIPSDIELEVGRVDLARLPSFPQTEIELLRRYLDKDHRFRHRLLAVEQAGLIDDGFGLAGGEAFAAGAWNNFPSLLGPGNVSSDPWFPTLNEHSRLWAFAAGAGTYSSVGASVDMQGFASLKSDAVFTAMFGSYFGDWDHPDALLRGPLAAAGSGLTCVWAGRPFWYLHHMGLGRTIGYSTLVTQNNADLYPPNLNGRGVHIALMGDPSLRMQYAAPPSAFRAQWDGSTGAVLNWTAPADGVDGYHVYRAASPAGSFQRLDTGLLPDTNFTDGDAFADAIYMVRAVKLEQGNGGTWFNASQGVFSDLDPPTVTLAATVRAASEIAARPATVVFHRTGSIVAPLVVAYRVAGSGVSGVDYEALDGEVSIAAGCASAKLDIVPKVRADVQAGRTVEITLAPDAAYRIGKPAVSEVVLSGDGSAFRPFALTYTGLIAGVKPGRIVVTVDRSGTVTAVIRVSETVFRLTGTLTRDGTFSGRIPGQPGWMLNLALDLTSNSGALTGSLKRGGHAAMDFHARPGLLVTGKSAAAGYYTAAFPPDAPSGGSGAPEGAGWAVIRVGSHGHARIAGLLGDRTVLSVGAILDTGNQLPLFARLYDGAGWIAGEVGFPDMPDGRDVTGRLAWVRSPVFPGGFSTQVSLAGSRYALSDSRLTAWKLPQLAGNALWNAEGGGLSEPLSGWITLDRFGAATVLSPATHHLSVRMQNSDGLIAGSFVHPALGRTVRFRAVMLQRENRAVGAFSGEGRSGLIAIGRNAELPGAIVGGRNGDDIRPTVVVQYPLDATRIEETPATPALYVFGTAADDSGISVVEFQTLHAGTLSPLGTASGGSPWSFPLILRPGDGGVHTVFVRAIDINGNESELVSRTFTYVVTKDFTVTASRGGSVTAGYLGTTPREVGKSYTIVATAAPGYRFNGWTGSVVSPARRIQFTMEEGFRLEADFAPE